MDIMLLGRPTVRLGHEQAKLAGRQHALLARLALDAPRTVSSDALIDVLWDEDLPADPANALQQRISALRKVLDPNRVGQVLVTAEQGYALKVDHGQIDAHRFTRLAKTGSDLLAAGEAVRALPQLEQALELWQGEPLEGFNHEPWAIAEAQRLREIHLRVREDRFAALLESGAGIEIVAELTEFVTSHPLRERACGQLLTALYRAGRQADALAFYNKTRQLLVEELGVDPSPELQKIYEQVLDQDTNLNVDAPGQRLRRAWSSGNIPAATVAVIGRDQAVSQVTQLLANARLVTLTGPGGAGKTTLALEAARRHDAPAHGIWLIELASLTSDEKIVETIATSLGLASEGLGSAADLAGLAELLTDLDLLLVLDNCEHIIDGAASVVERLLAAAANLKVLATSREPLGVPGELIWSVPALATPSPDEQDTQVIAASAAVALLVERARLHTPGFVVDDNNAQVVSSIVQQLDGVPLAIELAAARTRALSLQDLADGLSDRFGLLVGRNRNVPSRQQTLRATLDWSWDLLGEAERLAWAALSVPVGWFTHEDIAPLLVAAGVEGSGIDALADLVDRSLLTADTGEDKATYRMLETIKAYGREKLLESGSDFAVRAAHAEVVASQLAECFDRSDPAAYGVDLDRLRSWLGEARASLAWAEQEQERERIQVIAGRLGWLWLLNGLSREGIAWLDLGLGAIHGTPPKDIGAHLWRGEALLWASALRSTGANPNASDWAALSLEAELDAADRVYAEVFAAVHKAHNGEVDSALADLQKCVDRAGGIGGWPLGFAHVMTAQIGRLSGRRELASKHAELGLQLVAQAGVPWAQVQAIEIMMNQLEATGDYQRIRDLATEGLALCRTQNVPELEALILLRLGAALHELGEPDQGLDQVNEAVELSRVGGRRPTLGYALVRAGSLARRRGELDVAREQLTEAAALLSQTATGFGSAWVSAELALTAVAEGRDDQTPYAVDSLRMASEIGDPVIVIRGLAALSAATAELDHATSVRAVTTARVLSDLESVVVGDVREMLEHCEARLQERLGDEFTALAGKAKRAARDNAATVISAMITSLD